MCTKSPKIEYFTFPSKHHSAPAPLSILFQQSRNESEIQNVLLEMSQFFLQPIFFLIPSIFFCRVVKSYLNFEILFPMSLQTAVFIIIIRDIFH